MKYLHEKYPISFGIIILILYFSLDFVDARYFLPKRIAEAKQCELNDKCRSWINTYTDCTKSKFITECSAAW